jgi:hypothetical protein
VRRALVCLPLAVALVPAAAASAPRKALALTATPARVVLRGSGTAIVRIRNPGEEAVVVDAGSAGFALDLRGRPRVVKRHGPRSAAGWLSVRPAHFRLPPHRAVSVIVTARVPPRAEPGDHDALVLLGARPLARARVTIQLRLGVVVLVRAPGAVVRRLRLGRLRAARRRGGGRALELVVINAGNVTERIRRVRVTVARVAVRPASISAGARELRPRSRGVLEFRVRGGLRGVVAVRVVVPAEPGRSVLRRTYRLRL